MYLLLTNLNGIIIDIFITDVYLTKQYSILVLVLFDWAERNDFWPWLWFSLPLFSSLLKKEKKKRRMNNKSRDKK